MSTTKNPNQRVHYVLAENRSKAQPILERLRINGLQSRNRVYVYAEHQLQGVRAANCAFIFGPEYARQVTWPRLGETVMRLIREGAVKKADPEAAFQKREAERRAEEARARAEEAARQIDRGLVDIPTGGLWDQLKGPGGVYTGNAPFIEYAKTHIGYKQYCVGGPHHGKRCKDLPTVDGGEVEIPVRSALSFAPGLSFTKSRYRAYTAEILGQPVLFWVHEPSWSDRQRLVRDFVLMPLEV